MGGVEEFTLSIRFFVGLIVAFIQGISCSLHIEEVG
jgi:hypothetical protein